MEKLKLIRIVNDEISDTYILIFKVEQRCNLSEISLVFKKNDMEYSIPLPDTIVDNGDFIWVNNLHSSQLENYIFQSNSSSTRTLVIILDESKFSLKDFVRIK